MIRMGRGSKTEPETTNYQGTTTGSAPGYQYQSESVAATPSRAVTDSESMARDIKEGRLSGYVGHGTALTGETNFQAMLRVDGHLVGTVSSDSGMLLVGTNGQVDANVIVSSAMINGNVNGDIIATEKIQLGRTARVIGNIQTPRIIIEDGAVFEGSCLMLKAKEAIENKEAQPESQYNTAENEQSSDDEAETAEIETSYLNSTEDEDEDDEKADAAVI